MKATGLNRAERRRLERSPGRRSNRGFVVAAALTVLAIAVVATVAIVNRKNVPKSASEAPIYAPLAVGSVAPAFQVTTVDGRRIDSSEIAKPILLEVFATWCPHCQKETAALNAVNARFGGKIAIVAVSGSDVAADRTSTETLDDVRAFARYFGVTYPIAFDPDLAVAKDYLQGGFPTIVFIGSNKKIGAIMSGEVPLAKLTHFASNSK